MKLQLELSDVEANALMQDHVRDHLPVQWANQVEPVVTAWYMANDQVSLVIEVEINELVQDAPRKRSKEGRRATAKNTLSIECAVCQKPFKGDRRTKYCSATCSREARKEQERQWRAERKAGRDGHPGNIRKPNEAPKFTPDNWKGLAP